MLVTEIPVKKTHNVMMANIVAKPKFAKYCLHVWGVKIVQKIWFAAKITFVNAMGAMVQERLQILLTKEMEILLTKDMEILLTKDTEILLTKDTEILLTKDMEILLTKDMEILLTKDTEILPTKIPVKKMHNAVMANIAVKRKFAKYYLHVWGVKIAQKIWFAAKITFVNEMGAMEQKSQQILPTKDTEILPTKDTVILPTKDTVILPTKDTKILPPKVTLEIPVKKTHNAVMANIVAKPKFAKNCLHVRGAKIVLRI